MTACIWSAQAEESEAEALYDIEARAPAGARASLGIAAARIGGGVAVSMRHDPTGGWSRALGFGFQERVTADLIAEVCGFYRRQEIRSAVIQLAPSVLPEDWPDICAKWNLSPGPWLHKLVCATPVAVAQGRITRLGDGLRAGCLEAAHAAAWASVVIRGFGMPEGSMSHMVAACVGRPGWHAYAVRDDEDIVAGAVMHVRGQIAQLSGGATLPSARGRGAQSALLAARALAARAAGCQWLVAETGVETPGIRNSSLRNMLRMGFIALYQRQNWIWRSASPGHPLVRR